MPEATEVRRMFAIAEVKDDDANSLVMVTWELYRNGDLSHTYEQFYPKEAYEQLKADVGESAALPFKNIF